MDLWTKKPFSDPHPAQAQVPQGEVSMWLPMPQKHKNNIMALSSFWWARGATCKSWIPHHTWFELPFQTLGSKHIKMRFFHLVLGGIYCNLAHFQIGKAKMQIAAKSFNIPHKSGQKSPWVKQAYGKNVCVKLLCLTDPLRRISYPARMGPCNPLIWSSPIANSSQCTYFCDWATSFYANLWPNENAKGQGSGNQIKSLINSGKFRVQTGFINNLWKPGQGTTAVVCLQRQWDIAILLVDLSCWIPWRQLWMY